VKFAESVFVLHGFQNKSRSGKDREWHPHGRLADALIRAQGCGGHEHAGAAERQDEHLPPSGTTASRHATSLTRARAWRLGMVDPGAINGPTQP